jgi:capsular polysaccharide biosynthesis protein
MHETIDHTLNKKIAYICIVTVFWGMVGGIVYVLIINQLYTHLTYMLNYRDWFTYNSFVSVFWIQYSFWLYL